MRWVLIILGALLLLAVWVIGILFPELRWLAEWVTAAVVFIVLLVFLVRWIRTRLKAAALERELLKQAAASVVERPEVVELRAEMRKAFAALKLQSRSKANALYELPWYVIVGPPAVGKTTALERSGLTFLKTDRGSPKLRGAAGTRNCDWWLSPEAILLDTAGRYATSGEDHEEWVAFLDSVRRIRPERPLDGMIVAVSAQEIATATDAEREELASKLRERIDEVLERLEMVVPVYLLLTKADLIAGFIESMGDLTKPQRAQIWGASFEVNDPRLAEPARAIEAEIDELGQRLHARLLDRLPAERHPGRRARILQFPLEFRALGAPLGQFVDALLRPRLDAVRPLFRGFYLTSGTQVGRPVDRVVAGMARGFELVQDPRATAQAAPGGEVHSYFLADVFRAVMFRDRDLAVRSAEGVERRSRRELRAALIAIGVALFILLPAVVSYVRNMHIAGTVSAITTVPSSTEPGTREDPIETMADLLIRVDQESSGFGIPGWFGPRAAVALAGPLRNAYVARIHAELASRVRPELDRRLRGVSSATALADSPVTLEDRTPLGDGYETVKLYSMLVSPVGHVDAPWASQQLAHLWAAALPAGGAVTPERLAEHATNYLAALAIDPSLAWPAPSSLQGARDRLRRSDVRGLPYRRTLLYAADQPPLRVREMFGAASLEFLDCRGDVQIPAAFTANGWEKIHAALNASTAWPARAVVDAWVVGDASIPADEKGLRADVKSQYFEDYTRHWMTFLDELKVKTPPNLTAAKAELGALKDPEGFYKTLFAQFKGNAIHDTPPLDLLAAPAEGLLSKLSWLHADAGAIVKDPGPSPVERSFRPLLAFAGDLEGDKAAAGGPPGLDKYRIILDKLKAALDSSKPTGSDTQTQTQFVEASTGVEALLDGIEEPTHGRLRRLLLPPVEGTATVARTEGYNSVSMDWKTTVYKAYSEQLIELFPFKGNAQQAVNFADFSGFFHPESGILWAFVKARLGDQVELGGGGTYVSKPGSDPLAPAVLACLTAAQDITDAFFPAGEEPGVKFSFQADWSATDVTEAKLLIGAKPTPLPRGQWAGPIKWFGDDAKLEWVQGGQPTDQIGRHSFSLYDLFKQIGGLTPLSGGRSGIYVGESPPLSIKVRSSGKADPFRADFFAKLRCPPEIQGDRP
jgi:type VI secretion system protein ImpL